MSQVKICSIIFLMFVINNGYSQNQWVNGYGGSSQDICNSIVTDDQDNIYMTGQYENTVDFDPTTGVDIHTTNISYTALFVQKLDPNGNVIWTKTIGGQGDVWGRTLELDSQGNVYITGYYLDTIDFDPGPGVFEMTSNIWQASGVSSVLNTFVLKLGNIGNFQWVSSIGGDSPSWDTFYAPDVKIIGNEIVIISSFAGIGDLDSGPGIDIFDTGGAEFPIIVKFDLNGNFVWSKLIESNNLVASKGLFIEADSDNNLYIAGFYRDTVDFDPGPNVSVLVNPSTNSQVFVLKLNGLGEFIWVKELLSTGSSFPYGFELGQRGSLFLTGVFNGTSDFDTDEIGVSNLTSINEDLFVCKMDTSGNLSNVEIIATGAPFESYVYNMNIDLIGDIHIIGYYASDFTFEPITNPTVYTPDVLSGFVLTLDSSGIYKDLNIYNSQSSGGGVLNSAVSSDSGGNLIFSIAYEPDISIDIQGSPTLFSSNGELDILLVKRSLFVGIDELSINEILIYPNPTTGTCIVEANDKIEKLEIVDVNGRNVIAIIYLQNNMAIVSGLESGVYLLTVVSTNGFSKVKRLVAQ